MIDFFVLIMFCTFLAYMVEVRGRRYGATIQAVNRDKQAMGLYFIMLIAMILFAALRTTYNDTGAYMYGYVLLDCNNIQLKTLVEPYGGFTFFQQIIKKYISADPQTLIVVTAIILNILFVAFIKRNSYHFSEAIYLFLTGNYLFCMAGIKQALAMGISLYAIENMMKNRYIRAMLWLLISATFHPYIICMIILPFFKKSAWSKRVVFFIGIAVVCVANLETVLNIVGIFGKDYTVAEMSDGGINPFRVLIESIPVLISFIYRQKLNKTNDKFLSLGINMLIVRFCFIAIGLFVNPIYFARIGTYFSVLYAITVPRVLAISFVNTQNGKFYKIGYYVLFTVYFLLDMIKLGSISIFYDFFNHISFWELF